MLLRPKSWDKFQHYKDRCPPWIKLHRDLLTDREFMRLPIASKAIAPLMWLLASESKDGTFDGSIDELQFRLHITKKEYEDGIKPLIDKGFFIVDSSLLASSKQHAIPETETEGESEKETKSRAVRFEIFWKAYPKKIGKHDAMRSFDRRKVDDKLLQSMLKAIEVQIRSDAWKKDGGQFIPYPATWLNQGRWEDEGVTVALAPVNTGPDPALVKIEQDRAKAAPMPEHIRQQINSVLRKA